jgi:hypothetical protein
MKNSVSQIKISEESLSSSVDQMEYRITRIENKIEILEKLDEGKG